MGLKRPVSLLLGIFFGMLSVGGDASEPYAPRVSALPSPCPQIWQFFRVGRTDRFAAVFGADVPQSLQARLRVFNGTKSYDLTIASLAITIPTRASLVHERSSAIVMHVPDPVDGVAMLATFDVPSQSCPIAGRRILTQPNVKPSGVLPAYASLQAQIDDEVSRATAVDVEVDSTALRQCDTFFKAATGTTLISPEYPLVDKQQNDTGTVTALVELDNTAHVRRVDIFGTSGHPTLDEAAVRAAAASTYAPEIVACEPVGGIFVFRADFTAQ